MLKCKCNKIDVQATDDAKGAQFIARMKWERPAVKGLICAVNAILTSNGHSREVAVKCSV